MTEVPNRQMLDAGARARSSTRDFVCYLLCAMSGVLAFQIQAVAIGWELYQRTRSPMALAWAGCARALPIFLFGLIGGQLADRFDRRRLLAGSLFASASLSGLLALLASRNGPAAGVELSGAIACWPYYAVLFLSGCLAAISMPARQSLLATIVPRERFPQAFAWNSALFQIAMIGAPLLAGFLLELDLSCAYLVDGALRFAACCAALLICAERSQHARQAMSWSGLTDGLRFLMTEKALLAAMALDLVAVLLGGVTALLPIFAIDVLSCGESGLGWLRASPGIGSLCMAVVLAFAPFARRQGAMLLWSVGAFGFATVLFGLSTTLWLALFALFLTGIFDQVGAVIRHSLMQALAPDRLRGRISAVNGLFVHSSNQLGEFESGVVAALVSAYLMSTSGFVQSAESLRQAHAVGASASAVIGGLGTIAVAVVVAALCPRLRRLGSERTGRTPTVVEAQEKSSLAAA